MATVTVSSKYQIVIPQKIRERLRIRKGQKMSVLAVGTRIEVIPDRDIREMRGFLNGMSTENVREEDDRY